MIRRLLQIAPLAALAACVPAAAEDLNLFEWSAVAPIVAEVEVLSMDGPYAELSIDRVFRGELPHRHLMLSLKAANRERNRVLEREPLRMGEAERYVLLLEERPKGERSKLPVYHLVRGVDGARPVPPEGRPAFFAALEAFVAIHDLRSDNLTWLRFAEMLDETNPLMLQTALEQFVKFRRGEAELGTRVLPLLAHPRPDLRRAASALAGQLVERWGPEAIPEVDLLRAELIAVARRDPRVEVRVAATEALEGFGDEATTEVLREISASDPDQNVRYAAERLLYEQRRDADAAAN